MTSANPIEISEFVVPISCTINYTRFTKRRELARFRRENKRPVTAKARELTTFEYSEPQFWIHLQHLAPWPEYTVNSNVDAGPSERITETRPQTCVQLRSFYKPPMVEFGAARDLPTITAQARCLRKATKRSILGRFGSARSFRHWTNTQEIYRDLCTR